MQIVTRRYIPYAMKVSSLVPSYCRNTVLPLAGDNKQRLFCDSAKDTKASAKAVLRPDDASPGARRSGFATSPFQLAAIAYFH